MCLDAELRIFVKFTNNDDARDDMETRLLVNVRGYDGFPVDVSRYTIVKTHFLIEAPYSQVAEVTDPMKQNQ